ncbi:MAG: carbon-nitrogen hydrolase family protein [Planctomycetota bacterium]
MESLRHLLQAWLALCLLHWLAACHAPAATTAANSPSIALLHLDPRPGEIEANRRSLVHAVEIAAEAGADLIVTPELCTSGYAFSDLIGIDWIQPPPDDWLRGFLRIVMGHHTTVLVGLPERDPETGLLHNAMLAIGQDGEILGRHRKIRTLKVGSESWSSPGAGTSPVVTSPFGAIGMLICADAVDPSTAAALETQGAQLLVSSANWAPGLYGPDGEWERCSNVTSLPIVVCNRTGIGRTLDFSAAESVIICRGHRRLTLSSREPVIFLIHWDLASGEPIDHERLPL